MKPSCTVTIPCTLRHAQGADTGPATRMTSREQPEAFPIKAFPMPPLGTRRGLHLPGPAMCHQVTSQPDNSGRSRLAFSRLLCPDRPRPPAPEPRRPVRNSPGAGLGGVAPGDGARMLHYMFLHSLKGLRMAVVATAYQAEVLQTARFLPVSVHPPGSCSASPSSDTERKHENAGEPG